jgi:8-oxo-dGTP pyrophosphatase MutT (NUDIX family)
MRIKEIAAGGVVVNGDRVLLLENARGEWVFPKGKLERGEHYSRAAIREVAEETGLRARVVCALPQTRYVYQMGEQPIEKTVHWFLMAPESGTVVMPVERFRQAIWLGLDDAAHRLTWEEDRGLIAAARASSGNTAT